MRIRVMRCSFGLSHFFHFHRGDYARPPCKGDTQIGLKEATILQNLLFYLCASCVFLLCTLPSLKFQCGINTIEAEKSEKLEVIPDYVA